MQAKILCLALILVVGISPAAASAAQKGCCQKHGGPTETCSAAGKITCKDGTESPSCKCAAQTTGTTGTTGSTGMTGTNDTAARAVGKVPATVAHNTHATNPNSSTRAADGSGKTCCKHCTKGVACGNGCIKAGSPCHKEPGCAC